MSENAHVDTLEDSSKDSDDDKSSFDSDDSSDDECFAIGDKLSLVNSNERPKQPTMLLGMPKTRGQKIVFNKEKERFQLIRRESNISHRSASP